MVEISQEEYVKIDLPDGTEARFPVVILDDGSKSVDFSELYEKTGIRLADDSKTIKL